jgi:hypothetical protein
MHKHFGRAGHTLVSAPRPTATEVREESAMYKRVVGVALAVVAALILTSPVGSHAPSGAIFTTVADGSEVNFNHYPSKEAVYLDGGPGVGAPQTAAGLDDGTYVFQVTDPSGKTLLSEDAAKCRQFTVADGIITAVVVTGCQHVTGNDVDHPPAKTVQLMPYKNTSNPGGVYKAWVTRVEDFLLGCQQLGKPGATGLDLVDCGNKTGGNAHGFIPSHSKTDNFKVKDPGDVREIDTRFFNDKNGNGHKDAGEEWLLGRQVTWNDPLGASNKKWSYLNTALDINNEAHVEAVEDGIHKITISNQPGCTVGLVHLDNVDLAVGPQTVSVEVTRRDKNRTWFIDVACTVQ